MVGLLYSAMFSGSDLEIGGTVSETLLFRINTYAIPILNGMNPDLKKIRVSATNVTRCGYPDADVNGAGFSGGIDSFYTILNRSGADTPEQFKINTLFFFNVGSHGMGAGEERLRFLEDKFRARLSVLRGFADEIGMPIIPVNSNLHSFHQSGHLQTSSLASISAALFLGKKIRHYYLGSPGLDYYHLIRMQDTFDSDIEMINDYLLPQLCTESFTAIPDGSDTSRAGKTEKLLSCEQVRRYMNVCANLETVETNCSICHKCRRTMMTLNILGALDDFSDIFELEKFDAKARRRYAAEILNRRKSDPFLEDIYLLAENRGYNLRGSTDSVTRLYMAFTRTPLFWKLRNWKRGK